MTYKEIEGNIFNVGAQVIVHQVNCMGIMGSGVAKQVRDRFPNVYLSYLHTVKTLNHDCLGGCLVIDSEIAGLRIANLFGQYYYRGYKADELYVFDEFWKKPELSKEDGLPVRFTNYEAFWNGLTRLKDELKPEEVRIAFPYNIGSDRGGANWNVIREMIKAVFEGTNKEIMICRI